LIHK